MFLNALNQPQIKTLSAPARKRKRDTRVKRTHLLNGSGVTKTPASPRVRLTNGIARVAASALGRFTAKARATIVLRAFVAYLVNVITELCDS
jgi:hypothetical protein